MPVGLSVQRSNRPPGSCTRVPAIVRQAFVRPLTITDPLDGALCLAASCELQHYANEGCKTCASLAGLLLTFTVVAIGALAGDVPDWPRLRRGQINATVARRPLPTGRRKRRQIVKFFSRNMIRSVAAPQTCWRRLPSFRWSDLTKRRVKRAPAGSVIIAALILHCTSPAQPGWYCLQQCPFVSIIYCS